MTGFGRWQMKYYSDCLLSKKTSITRWTARNYSAMLFSENQVVSEGGIPMRILLRILLFPVTLILTVLVLFCQFICLFSTALLSILSFVIFGFSLFGLFLTAISASSMFPKSGIPSLVSGIVLAYLISPYGIPMFAAWFISKVEAFNGFLKSI